MADSLKTSFSDAAIAEGAHYLNEAGRKRVIVGVCAMAKKSQSKPMSEILTRLSEFEYIETVVFAEDVILNEPVERWPLCDCLISFHSKGFPLAKAIKYAELRKPFSINDLYFQYDIQDRRRVYKILEDARIELPRYAVLNRDSEDSKIVESEDHVEVSGVVFNKPFVEKPVSAEDHNIYIYYPTSAGGGSQRLFRKIGSRSSVYSPESKVRKSGSYIYEEFMPTDGTDVKVYTVGPDYAHAEARKSPALDGKVERDKEGKEVRYPVILTNEEKLIARKVCLAFKQAVCGFDLLRANGKSYVCDVNGFSFVKNSMKYYDDCAKILGNMILRELAPQLHIPWSMPFQLDDPPIVPTTIGKMMELRCVVGVIRHGDRTPKQKMKMEVKNAKFFQLFEKHGGFEGNGHIKLKKPKQLQEVLDIARDLLSLKDRNGEIEENHSKLEQLKAVLEMYGHFSGINRKVQLKYQPKGRPRNSSSDDSETPRQPSLVLILKWGGELTPAGRVQAEELGRVFRCMYPGGGGDYSGSQGLGLLRLHSTFRHDLKIYASDEGRVSMTAAAFAKGLLALEGELTPILVQMVKSANTNGLLDNDCDAGKFQNMVKQRLHEAMQVDREFSAEDKDRLNPTKAASIEQAMRFIKNPLRACQHVFKLIRELTGLIKTRKDTDKGTLYHGESWDLMQRRWAKLEKDFKVKPNRFDISKIPDVYDCIKYDLQHNQHALQFQHAEELYNYAKALADIVIPLEYGITRQEKLAIGLGICSPLLKKIRADLHRNTDLGGEAGDGAEGNPTQVESENRLNPQYSYGVSSPGRHVRTRLYFTSESHIHSLLTVLRYGGLIDSGRDEQWRRALSYISEVSELNYMTQIVIMLYEDETKDVLSEERFHVELHFSPGAMCCVQKNPPAGPGFRPQSQSERSSSPINEDSCSSPETGGSQINLTVGKVNAGCTTISNIASDTGGSVKADSNSLPASTSNRCASPPLPDGAGSSGGVPVAGAASQSIGAAPGGGGGTASRAAEAPLPLGASASDDVDDDDETQPSGYNPYHTVGGYPVDSSTLGPFAARLAAAAASAVTPADFCIMGDVCGELTTDTATAPAERSLVRQQQQQHIHQQQQQQHLTSPMAFLNAFRRQHGFGTPGSAVRSRPSLLSAKHFNLPAGNLFSTAVISGSSSAPDLRTALLPVSSDGRLRVPSIRPLETLHNALSLYQLDVFLSEVTSSTYRTSLVPSYTPVGTGADLGGSSGSRRTGILNEVSSLGLSGGGGAVSCCVAPVSPSTSWLWPIGSGPPSFVSSSGPSTPTSSTLDIWLRLKQVVDLSQPAHGSTGGASSTLTEPESLPSSRSSYSTPPSPHENRSINAHRNENTTTSHFTLSQSATGAQLTSAGLTRQRRPTTEE